MHGSYFEDAVRTAISIHERPFTLLLYSDQIDPSRLSPLQDAFTFDINTDGVANYGLYPDWIEDLRHLAGDEIVNDMGRGAEAYLEMWERAAG